MVFKMTDLAAEAAVRKAKRKKKGCKKHTCHRPTPQTCCRETCRRTTGGPSTCDLTSTEGRAPECQDFWNMQDRMDALARDVESLVAAREGRKIRSRFAGKLKRRR